LSTKYLEIYKKRTKNGKKREENPRIKKIIFHFTQMDINAVVIITLFLFIPVVYAGISLAPWIPTRKKDLKRIHTLANLQPHQKFIEIGCGNGRVCSSIAKKNPRSEVIGIELALPLYLFSKIRTLLFGPRNLTILFGNALQYPFSEANILYIFGLPNAINKKFRSKVLREVKNGGKIISYAFPITEWNGEERRDKPSKEDICIYIYEKIF
jgi:SAM-dependent methyltransferase